jgi:putative endonuclease
MWPFRRKGADHPTTTQAIGARGESLAQKTLRQSGFRILARNYLCSAGEADLIAEEKATRDIVFVEVKTRTGRTHVEPYAAVNAAKQIRYRRVAQHYMLTHEIGERTVRFDVVSIVLTPGQSPEIEHIPNAFA